MRALPRAARVYLAFVLLAALALLAGLPWAGVSWSRLLVIGALFMLLDSVSTVIVRDTVTMTAASPVMMAGVVLLGPLGAAMVGALSTISHEPAKPPWFKRAFNGAQFALAAALSGTVYWALGGHSTLVPQDFPIVLGPFAAATVAFVTVNGLLMSGIIATSQKVPFAAVWWDMLRSSVLPYLGYGLFGLMMAVLWSSPSVGPLSALLVLLPLLVARWAFSQYAEQRAAYDSTVRALVQAVETKDLYTRGHSERVALASVMIARVIGMREDRIASLRYAGILHDVGKLGVPTKVLQKSGPLTDLEFAAIQLHPVRGLEMVREIAFLDEAFSGIMHHHERLDGRGYPMGLTGDQIPEFARVIAVADAFDSMTSTRSYRGARTTPDAVDELERCKGTQFDAYMVDALKDALDEAGWEAPAAPELPADAERVVIDHDDPTASIRVMPPEGM